MSEYPGCLGPLSAYCVVLTPGHPPRDPHDHEFEEVVVVVEGSLDILTGEGTDRIRVGRAFHLPPGVVHTIKPGGPQPAAFLACRWTPHERSLPPDRGALRVFEAAASESCELIGGGRLVVDPIRASAEMRHGVRADDHDLMLILLRGRLHALGHTTDAPAVIYYPAGMVHALAPVNDAAVDLLAFEFHRPASL